VAQKSLDNTALDSTLLRRIAMAGIVGEISMLAEKFLQFARVFDNKNPQNPPLKFKNPPRNFFGYSADSAMTLHVQILELSN